MESELVKRKRKERERRMRRIDIGKKREEMNIDRIESIANEI